MLLKFFPVLPNISSSKNYEINKINISKNLKKIEITITLKNEDDLGYLMS